MIAVFWLLLAAQSSQTGLVGEIVDPSGKAVRHATLRLLSVETNAFFSSASGQDGRYLFNEVRPGRYSVTVEADGFQKIIQPAVTLAAGERIRLDFSLTIGSIEESLTIRADAPLLRTESADLGHVIDQRRIVDLPLNGRSFISLAGLVPGVALPSGSAFPRINGGRPQRTNICSMALRFCSRNQDKLRSCRSWTRSRNSKSKRMAHRLRGDASMGESSISRQNLERTSFTAPRSNSCVTKR